MGGIVVDIGCAKYGGDESIPHLIDEFHPTTLYGFDPSATDEGYRVGDTNVIISTEVAWTYDGTVGFIPDTLSGRVEEGAPEFPCFDLARFIAQIGHAQEALGDRPNIVLKMDAEGSEYALLPHLIAKGVDKLLTLALIEWHCLGCHRGGCGDHREDCPTNDWGSPERNAIEGGLRCDLREWGH